MSMREVYIKQPYIDGVKLSNNTDNLHVTTKSEHQTISKQYELPVQKLYKEGTVQFNKETGEYYKS